MLFGILTVLENWRFGVSFVVKTSFLSPIFPKPMNRSFKTSDYSRGKLSLRVSISSNSDPQELFQPSLSGDLLPRRRWWETCHIEIRSTRANRLGLSWRKKRRATAMTTSPVVVLYFTFTLGFSNSAFSSLSRKKNVSNHKSRIRGHLDPSFQDKIFIFLDKIFKLTLFLYSNWFSLSCFSFSSSSSFFVFFFWKRKRKREKKWKSSRQELKKKKWSGET